MATMSDFNLRVEAALSSTPRTVSPGYTDLTAYSWMADGIDLERGRSNPQDTTAQAGQASASLNNVDSRFTMGNGSSPYAPLQLRRPFRFSCRYNPSGTQVPGNLFDAESASFEAGGLGNWSGGTFGYTAAAIANSTTHAQFGTKACQITWPAVGALGSAVTIALGGLTIGRAYTLSVYAWVTAATPALTLADPFGTTTSGLLAASGFALTTSTTGAFQRIAATFTALAGTVFLCVKNNTTATSGQLAWVDGWMLDEGTTVGTFTTTAPVIYNLWAGFNEDWGNRRIQTTGVARLSLSDRLARAATIKLQAALKAEILSDAPNYFYPLSDGVGTTKAGDVTGAAGVPTLSVTQLGTAGTLDFGGGLAPGPDTATVAAFTRSSVVNGKYLVSGAIDANGGITGTTLRATVRPSTTSQQMDAARLYCSSGIDGDVFMSLGISGLGKARVMIGSLVDSILINLVGTTTLPTTSLTDIAVTVANGGGSTWNVTLLVNGVSEGTSSYTRAFALPFYYLNVGGYSGGDLWDGQISNVAVWRTPLTAARLLDHAAGRAGWVGETTSARFNRICRTSGLPSSSYSAPVAGSSTMAAQPTANMSLLDALKTVADAEQGVVYVDGSGALKFAARTVRYNATVGLTLDATKAGQVGADTEFITDTSTLVNDVSASRPNGPTLRVVDATSVTNYDTHDKTITLYVDTDNLAQGAAEWIVYSNSTPEARTDSVTVNVVGYANSGGDVNALLSADVGTRLADINLPADVSATSTVDLFIEGIKDSITKSSWFRTFTTSPIGQSGSVMVLDDATYGRLDLGGLLAF